MQIEMNSCKPKNTFLFFIYDNRNFLISLLFLLSGIFIGALTFGNDTVYSGVFKEEAFLSYFVIRRGFSFFTLFFYSFISAVIYVSAIFIAAFGISGIPIIPLILFFRGFGTCTVACVLYNSYLLKGVAYFCLVLLLPMLLLDFVLILYSAYAFEVSGCFLSLLRDISSRGIKVRPYAVIFLKKTAFCLLYVFCIALLEALLSECLSAFFVF